MASLKTLVPTLALGLLLFTVSEAKEFLVGGKENSWAIPKSNETFNQWAAKIRFTVGDFLLWKYDAKTDSVLEVTKHDYESCNTSKPIEEYKDGNSKIELKRSGPFYFISGANGHCEKGQKLEVIVLSDNHSSGGSHGGNTNRSSVKAAPAPAPKPNDGGYGLKGGFVVVGLVLMSLVELLNMGFI